MDSFEIHETMLQRAEKDDAAHNHNLKLEYDLNVRKVEALEGILESINRILKQAEKDSVLEKENDR